MTGAQNVTNAAPHQDTPELDPVEQPVMPDSTGLGLSQGGIRYIDEKDDLPMARLLEDDMAGLGAAALVPENNH